VIISDLINAVLTSEMLYCISTVFS